MDSEVVAASAQSPTLPERLGLDPSLHAHYLALLLLGVDPNKLPLPTRGRECNYDDFKGTDRTLAVALALNAETPLLYVEHVGRCYRPASVQTPHLYRPFEDYEIKRLVKRLWMRNLRLMGSLDTKKIKECVEMVKECTREYQEDLSRRYIAITPELFWDTDLGTLTEAPEQPVFFSLFDTPNPNNHFIKIPPFTKAQIDTLKEEYQKSLKYLEQHNGDLPEDYLFVSLWANYSHDVYMDIMKMFASPFMRRKPFGSFMAIGLKRNGKTAATGDFMKTLLGTANCSSIQLAQLGDPHHNATLQWTLWNAPDEEDERPTQYATIFKGLALDTPIPTPNGFSTMGELQEGDIVYDRNFKPTKILHKSEVHYNPCYRIEFTTGETVIADHEHRWVARVGDRGDYSAEQVYTTKELASLILDKTIKIANPQDNGTTLPEQLPVDPYVLGCWLGDGDKNQGIITNPSSALWQEIRRRGYEISENGERRAGRCERRTIYGLFLGLRQLGLLGHKSLPPLYLRAGRQIRLDVLRGLMDTDGSFGEAGPNRGGCVKMSTAQEWQRDAVCQLVSSLGWTPTCTVGYRTDFGKRVKVYEVAFAPTEDVFLTRNQGAKYTSSAHGALCRYVKSITPVATVPTQCIEVSSPTHTYLFGEGHIVTHNTIADHGEIKVSKLYSQEPITIDCNFMCAFPMNHHPVWTGSGAAACVARSLIIEFTHRFQEDQNPRTFAERTFTADLFSHILGPILALATYYLDRPIVFSETMRRQQYSLEGEMDSHTTYYDHFIAFFDGFQSVKLLYEDYKLWCAAHEVPVSSLPAFKLAFGAFTAPGRKNIRANGAEVKGYHLHQVGKLPLITDETYEVCGQRLGPVSRYQDSREPLQFSIVERCEAAVESKFGDKFEQQLNSLIISAQAAIAKRPEPELPPAPVQQPLEDDIFK